MRAEDALAMTLGLVLLSLNISWLDVPLWWAAVSLTLLRTRSMVSFAVGVGISAAAPAVPPTTVFGACIITSIAAKYTCPNYDRLNATTQSDEFETETAP